MVYINGQAKGTSAKTTEVESLSGLSASNVQDALSKLNTIARGSEKNIVRLQNAIAMQDIKNGLDTKLSDGYSTTFAIDSASNVAVNIEKITAYTYPETQTVTENSIVAVSADKAELADVNAVNNSLVNGDVVQVVDFSSGLIGIETVSNIARVDKADGHTASVAITHNSAVTLEKIADSRTGKDLLILAKNTLNSNVLELELIDSASGYTLNTLSVTMELNSWYIVNAVKLSDNRIMYLVPTSGANSYVNCIIVKIDIVNGAFVELRNDAFDTGLYGVAQMASICSTYDGKSSYAIAFSDASGTIAITKIIDFTTDIYIDSMMATVLSTTAAYGIFTRINEGSYDRFILQAGGVVRDAQTMTTYKLTYAKASETSGSVVQVDSENVLIAYKTASDTINVAHIKNGVLYNTLVNVVNAAAKYTTSYLFTLAFENGIGSIVHFKESAGSTAAHITSFNYDIETEIFSVNSAGNLTAMQRTGIMPWSANNIVIVGGKLVYACMSTGLGCVGINLKTNTITMSNDTGISTETTGIALMFIEQNTRILNIETEDNTEFNAMQLSIQGNATTDIIVSIMADGVMHVLEPIYTETLNGSVEFIYDASFATVTRAQLIIKVNSESVGRIMGGVYNATN